MTGKGSAANSLPLCVDLDGTLLRSDLAIESALALLKHNPFYLFAMLAWLLRGMAHLKHEMARRVSLDMATLPYDQRILSWLQQQHGNRPCLLVTASDGILAQQVADHIALFDEIIASNGRHNLAGQAKADVLLQRFGQHGFDYAGNSRKDLAVWRHAHAAIVVNANPRLLHSAARITDVAREFPRQFEGIRVWFKALRLHQWIKNLLLFAPLAGAHLLNDPKRLGQTVLAWFLFGLCASGTYLINDLLDLQADRQHPSKRLRAFANGSLDLLHGIVIAAILLVISLLVSACLLPGAFLSMLAAYLLLTLAYSLYLKGFRLLDVLALATLFTLRILAGGAAAGISVSIWLLGLSMLLFLNLAMLKRYTELHDLRKQDRVHAKGRGYSVSDLPWLLQSGTTLGMGSVLVLGLYIALDPNTSLYHRPELLWLLCPLLGAWLARAWWLAWRGKMHDDPIMFATHDIFSWLLILAGAAITWGAS